MSFHWITEPIALYGAIAASTAAALHLFITGKIELHRQARRHETLVEELRQSIAGLEGRLAAVEADAQFEERSRAAVPGAMPAGVNVQKRSEALRMCRRGAAPEVIMGRLGLSRAETLLLSKVHRALADAPSPQLVGSSQERSSSREYSLEA